jgi:VWFA-related protein
MRWLSQLAFFILLACGLTLAASAPASNLADQGDSAATIKTTTRVVLLDVLVADKAGQPVHGLKARDFTVLEDGKPQQVRGFEERGPTLSVSSAPQPATNLPPNTYTNYLTAREPGAVTILLFDTLNTDRQSLVCARKELLLYLSKLASNDRVALFTLDSGLHQIHGFSDDPQELIATAQALSSSPHAMYSNNRGVSDELAQAVDVGITGSPQMYQSVSRFLWAEQEGKEESRTFVTMQALNQLARSMAVLPGRKNLIWISGGFPFDPASTDPQMRWTSTLLAATQIAVYPIDVQGVKYLGPDGAAPDSAVFLPYGGSYDELSGQNQELLSIHESMSDIAAITGGKALFGRNDLEQAIRDSVNSGTNYYTLSYHPTNPDWNGKFRKLAVKVANSGLKVQSRPGYYAVPDPLGAPDINRTFTEVMQPTAPVSRTLIMKARVLLPGESEKPTRIDYLVDLHDISFHESSDQKQVPDVVFVASVWDAAGKPSGSISSVVRAGLTPAQYDSLLKTGMQLHQEIVLKPGTYQLRLGVVDRISGKIGTLDVPLSVESKAVTQ